VELGFKTFVKLNIFLMELLFGFSMSSDMDTVDWVLNNVTEGSLEKEVSNYSESNQLPWFVLIFFNQSI
jgi:hypothetical protein